MAAEGYRAPELTFGSTDSTAGISLADMRGKYVLVNFWASTDAQSRIQAKEYDRIAQNYSADRFSHVGVNTDSNKSLFREIMRRDGIDAESQHNYSDVVNPGRMTDDWHLKNGLRSYLIDPVGYIVAVNPSDETLEKYLGS